MNLVQRRVAVASMAWVVGLSAGCRPLRPGGGAPWPPTAEDRAPARLEVDWNPTTGRGEVRHAFANGDEAQTCFQCRYPGYTGGLVVGNLEDSGLAFVPRAPIRGYPRINVFCAIDESIFDLDEGAEDTYGWSENFGSGDDGVRIEYLEGRIIEGGPQRAVLYSRNAGGCYLVDKVATSRADAPWWIVATAVTNVCSHPVRFDFFTGDDPWLGSYRSSDGDVGWVPEGLLFRESEIPVFTQGGIYDLGNQEQGQLPERFSNQANFIEVDPAVPPPDRAFLANRFAHSREEIHPQHVLTNDAMVALNLGWTRRTLAPGDTMTVALAMGLAHTGEPGEIPRAPHISVEDWSVWRQWLPWQAKKSALELAAEEVSLDIEEGVLDVEGVYHFFNPGLASVAATVRYPVYSDTQQAAPELVAVDGHPFALEAAGDHPFVGIPLSVAPRSLVRLVVRYRQRLSGPRAVYLVTSARSWPSPIARAIFRIRHPARFDGATVSLPVSERRRILDRIEDTVLVRDFAPKDELMVEW